jgi:hypothetical protein
MPISINKSCLFILLAALSAGIQPAFAQDEDMQEALRRVEKLVQQQQKEIESQRKELAEQRALIQKLQVSQEKRESSEALASKEEPTAPPPLDTVPPEPGLAETVEVTVTPIASTQEDVEPETTLSTTDQFYDPSNTVYDIEFPGAWKLPGTHAAMKIGGYVNLSLINSFDPLLITDRFITGSIPVEGSSVEGTRAGMDVTANQTRVNWEVREQTPGGPLRAFIEGDFEGDNTTFRLRHAFGQYNWMLAGKTWSTLMDVDSRPEEVDFEGINGEVLVRQPQIRIFPSFWQNMKFKLALESPQTDVIGGQGEPGRSDVIVSVDRLPLGTLGSWNSRVGFIIRDLQGQRTFEGPGPGEPVSLFSSAFGYGVTTSGKKSITGWAEQDFLLWQVTAGKGIGRYINDLATMGGGDAVFDPSGDLRALPVVAGYVSYQHRWKKNFWVFDKLPGSLRSNFTVSAVFIDNYNFQDADDYRSTLRASGNLMYQPTRNVRLGMELLWGKRTNKDNHDGTATQLQFSARYDF